MLQRNPYAERSGLATHNRENPELADVPKMYQFFCIWMGKIDLH